MDESSQNVDNSTDINSDLDSLAAQKREARRRRILQNTSNRLGKITGRVHDDEPPGKNQKKILSKGKND